MICLRNLRWLSKAADYILHSNACVTYQRPCIVFAKSLAYSEYIYITSKSCHGLNSFSPAMSTMAQTILVQARDIGKLHEEIEAAILDRRLDDAWDLHEQHMKVEGFTRKSTFIKLIAALSESSDIHWLEKSYWLVEKAFAEHKHLLFEKEILMYISLSLARCGLAIPASTLLRKLIEMEQFPPLKVWSAIMAYMLDKSSGSHLAAELVLETGYLFQDGRVDPRKKCNETLIAMKPDATAFSIALLGCVLFRITKKAEQLLEMIPRIKVRTDATLLTVMSHVYERNGRREELRKLRRYVEEVPSANDSHLRQFYNCLLSCHLKLRDLDSASNMVLEMLHNAKKARNTLGVANLIFESDKRDSSRVRLDDSVTVLQNEKTDESTKNPSLFGSHFLSYDDFCRDRKFIRLEVETKDLFNSFLLKLSAEVDLITTEKGILKPTENTYLKLVKGYLESDKTKDLVEFLIKVEKEDSIVSSDDSVLTSVVNTCISLGKLDRAHDILDEMRLAGIKTSSSVYNSLLKAYYNENRLGEMKSLARDARRACIQLDGSSYEMLIQSQVLDKDTEGALNVFKEMKRDRIPRSGPQEFDKLVNSSKENKESGLMSKLLQEMKEVQTADSSVHEWNNVIHFFCKKRLMQDAEKALKKMRSLGYYPNAQTFHSLVTGYAAIGGKYIEVAELWGEMKSIALASGIKFDVELLDSVLYTFVSGGFFVRANEVVEMMEKDNMFVDKYKYRALFLKYHKTLYKDKAPKFQTESQIKKREAALAFKRWVGL